jgi:nucleoside-diphosphate-sugar epimerase
MMRIMIFGAGYSGTAFARSVSETAEFVGGTTRSTERFGALSQADITPFLFDGAVGDDLAAALATTTHLVASAAPGDDGDPVLPALPAMPALRWAGYLSTVGVYGDHQGRWVDEDTPCRPVSARSRARLDADEAWLSFGRERGLPVAVLRLSGIYGPGRNALVNLAEGTARRIVKLGQVFNRIHVDDIAGALLHLATRELGGIFNVTDDEPAPPQDVVSFAAGLMGVDPPPEIAFSDAAMTPMAKSFYGENKRVSNAKLKAGGYAFRFPDYRAAFTAMWREGNWRRGA